MEYQATAKYIRISPRKIRLVASTLSGKTVAAALSTLQFLSKRPADPIAKLLRSALSNAQKKQTTGNVGADTLFIRSFNIMEGPVVKRFRAVSRGMAHTYKKRMTHIHVVLTDKQEKKAKRYVTNTT